MREWLKNIRISAHMTQSDVAKAIGVSRTYYGRIEKGEYRIPVITAQKIAQVLGFDWTEFYTQDQKAGA